MTDYLLHLLNIGITSFFETILFVLIGFGLAIVLACFFVAQQKKFPQNVGFFIFGMGLLGVILCIAFLLINVFWMA